MDPASPASTPAWEPHILGPLSATEPVVTGPAHLFQGEEDVLSKRKLRNRIRLWEHLAETVEKVLDEEERVLYLAPAVEIAPFLERITLGWLWSRYFYVALVFTDRRLIEILLESDHKSAATRIRSFPWGLVREVKLGWGGLKLKLEKRRLKWALKVGADSRLLKPLMERVKEQLVGISATPDRKVPLWHCPLCGSAATDHPTACAACQTPFRSRALAGWLSLAFPGGGLFYAGHPVLGTIDFLGESFLYLILMTGVLTALDTQELIQFVATGALFLGLTKLESVHLARVLVYRTKPHSTRGRTSWRRFLAAGAVVSVLAVGLPFTAAGSLAHWVEEEGLATAQAAQAVTEPDSSR